ncbi:MAG: type III pantothenate kinase [Nitrospirae bacterium]|nr:type III pantothenate kinase [Nitrospirota bacterium]
MLLLIDIGNTSTKVGFYSDGVMSDALRLKTLVGGRDEAEYAYLLEGMKKLHRIKRIRGAAVCSVVPEVTPALINAVKKRFAITPLNVTHKTRTGLKFPAGTGADRIAQMVAAHRLYNGNVVIAAFGTATVFSAITGDGKYKGGAIMPGIELAVKALAGGTSKLPEVGLKMPVRLLSKDTENNILTGVILGHAGAAEKIIGEIEKELGGDLKVVATGGLFRLIRPFMNVIDIENPHLTFEGLRFIYEMNVV